MNPAPLSTGDLLRALGVIVIWGLNFVVMKVGLQSLSPMLLGALRFVVASLPFLLFVPRPALPWRYLVAYGLAQGVGQFGLLFLGLRWGMTAGMASVVMQTQAFFTLLMAASTIIYSVINQKHMPTQQGMPSMKLMIYLFPIMMLFFLNNYSAGLSYYYLLANLISIAQMTVLKSWFVDEQKIRAKLELNMRSPKKKSKWQQRLEDMQKQQQQTRRR